MNTPAISVEKSGAASVEKSGVNREVPVCVRDRRVLAGQRPSTPATRKSRLLKGASALQSRPRRCAGELRYSLVPLLTDRDREIVNAVARFRVFTAEQLAEMFFDTRKRAQVRLHRLHDLGVLERFRPYRDGWGSNPYHYVLGPLGAEMVAADAEEDHKPFRRCHGELGLALGRPRDLAHLVTLNGFYASLVGHARRHPKARLLDWMTAAEAAKWSDSIVAPDAFGEWAEGDRVIEFFLVVDRGGPVEALVADLSRYERFDAERGGFGWVLVVFLSRRRADRAQCLLAESVERVATAAAHELGSPEVTAWVLHDGGRRHRLIELAELNRFSPPGPDTASSPRAWLFERRRTTTV